MTVKERLHQLVDELPDVDPIEALQERLYVLRKVEKGLQSIDAGKTLSQEEVAKRIERCLAK